MEVLLAWVWQGALLAAVAAAALRVCHRLSATTRHLVWWVTLGGVLILPLVPGVLAVFGSAEASADPVRSMPGPGRAAWLLPAVPAWAIAALFGSWLGVVLLNLGRLACEVIRVADLKQRSRPVPERISRQLPVWMQVCERGRPTALRISDAVRVPCALGLGPAVILLPRRLVETLDPDALDQIVLHEHAHLMRRDDWWRLVQAAIEGVVGLHPVVHWIGRRIELEREAACDDAVVARTGSARRYASCLAQVAHVSARLRSCRGGLPALAPGATRSPSVLRQRVGRLLSGRRNGSLEPAWFSLAAGVAVVGLLVAALAQAPLLVAFHAEASGPSVPVSLASANIGAPAPLPARPVSRLELPPGPAQRLPVERAVARRRLVARGPEVSGGPDQTPSSSVPPASSSVGGVPGAAASPTVPVDEPLPAVSRFGDLHDHSLSSLNGSAGNETLSDRAGEGSPWQAFANAGTGIGNVSRKAGLGIGGFFARAGQAVASGF